MLHGFTSRQRSLASIAFFSLGMVFILSGCNLFLEMRRDESKFIRNIVEEKVKIGSSNVRKTPTSMERDTKGRGLSIRPDKPVIGRQIKVGCLNTKASEDLTTDEYGYTCSAEDVQIKHPGCCETNHSHTTRYSCESCNEVIRCCGRFEYCVSCCMAPSREKLRERLYSQRLFEVYRYGHTASDIMSPYAICNMACRSNSKSVVHENAYRNSHHHCYGIFAPPLNHTLHNGIFDFTKPSKRKKVEESSLKS